MAPAGMTWRVVQRVIPSIAAADGAGVKLRRSLGSGPFARLDPFLMLDEFFSDDADDYLAGFPSHPHRGFETVTYMLDGRMQHRDSGGNTGDLGPGDVQWMTAARGIIHSEMPQQTAGRMRGFQLWINLPAAQKMQRAAYCDIPASRIPVAKPAPGVEVKVIAGLLQHADGTLAGPVCGKSTDPQYFDIVLGADAAFEFRLPAAYNACLYAYEGEAANGETRQPLPHRSAAVLSAGEALRIRAGGTGARVLLLAGKPVGEPVVQYGPFVMNTREEIERAIADYQSGTFARDPVERMPLG
jgi:hypothetical protein